MFYYPRLWHCPSGCTFILANNFTPKHCISHWQGSSTTVLKLKSYSASVASRLLCVAWYYLQAHYITHRVYLAFLVVWCCTKGIELLTSGEAFFALPLPYYRTTVACGRSTTWGSCCVRVVRPSSRCAVVRTLYLNNPWSLAAFPVAIFVSVVLYIASLTPLAHFPLIIWPDKILEPNIATRLIRISIRWLGSSRGRWSRRRFFYGHVFSLTC